jgi:hypothetical protein
MDRAHRILEETLDRFRTRTGGLLRRAAYATPLLLAFLVAACSKGGSTY